MLGLVTIGQSPREDVVASMLGTPNPGAVIEAGALDGLSRDEIGQLTPEADEQPLVTRLRDGCEVVVGKSRILPYLKRAIAGLETSGCTTICVLCTGEFPLLGTSALMVYPDRLLLHVIEALLPSGTLGVLMPHEGQQAGMLKKWTTPTRTTRTAVASPYSASAQIEAEVRGLVATGADAIVLDCMGFDRPMLASARSATDKPVILANGIVGSVLNELIDVSIGLVDDIQRS